MRTRAPHASDALLALSLLVGSPVVARALPTEPEIENAGRRFDAMVHRTADSAWFLKWAAAYSRGRGAMAFEGGLVRSNLTASVDAAWLGDTFHAGGGLGVVAASGTTLLGIRVGYLYEGTLHAEDAHVVHIELSMDRVVPKAKDLAGAGDRQHDSVGLAIRLGATHGTSSVGFGPYVGGVISLGWWGLL